MGEPNDLVRRFYDAIQTERVDVAMALCDPDIAVRNPVVFTGTHTGPLRTPNATLPATGKPVRFEVVGVFEVEAGRIVSSRGLFDRLGFIEQLGLAPRLAAATSQAES